MTVGGIILGVFITIIIIVLVAALGFWGFDCDNVFLGILSIIIGICLIVGTWYGINWYYHGTEEGKRAVKTQQSNFDGGITREVKVYDVEGDLIQEYKGKFDVDYDNDRIIFDDEKGNRHIIYYPTGTVIIDEVEE